MEAQVTCPKCQSNYAYQDGSLWVCPECSNEWNPEELKNQGNPAERGSNVLDAHGNILQNGDTVSIIKDLKVKGASSSVKVGTKVKNIRLIEADDGHNIACKIEGFGAMNLKSEFVKKAT